jgi:hypothetical protein
MTGTTELAIALKLRTIAFYGSMHKKSFRYSSITDYQYISNDYIVYDYIVWMAKRIKRKLIEKYRTK